MARTTAQDVQELLGDKYEAAYPATSFITTANVMVTKHCVDEDFTDAELELIERYLAAHLYRLSHPWSTQERAGDVGESKQHVEKVGFAATEFGQMAMDLDWSGALKALGSEKRRSVDMSWAGKPNPLATETDVLSL